MIRVSSRLPQVLIVDKSEAKAIAEKELQFYRGLPHGQIAAKIGTQESYERVSERGEPYQIEFDFFYDDAESGNIRVVGMVSYSGWTEFFPVGSAFIVAQDGTFVGD